MSNSPSSSSASGSSALGTAKPAKAIVAWPSINDVPRPVIGSLLTIYIALTQNETIRMGYLPITSDVPRPSNTSPDDKQRHLETFDAFLSMGLPTIDVSEDRYRNSYGFSKLSDKSGRPNDQTIFIRKSLAEHIGDSPAIETLFVSAVLHEVGHVYRWYLHEEKTPGHMSMRKRNPYRKVGESGEVVELHFFGGRLTPVAKGGFDSKSKLEWSKFIRMDIEKSEGEHYTIDNEWMNTFLNSLRNESSAILPLRTAKRLPAIHHRFRLIGSCGDLNDNDTLNADAVAEESDGGGADDDGADGSGSDGGGADDGEADGGDSDGGDSDGVWADDSPLRFCALHPPSDLRDSPPAVVLVESEADYPPFPPYSLPAVVPADTETRFASSTTDSPNLVALVDSMRPAGLVGLGLRSGSATP
ncbi:hypothetical protein FA95DRAFT_1605964 [Auriscalpium vulgare]|uniref:Uncharacterized protein n=1 Tax=Auriscalpium vulgare TaxID=40419 RepID=A0ACB8RU30_9AGAM|nr:hypothetical protein FA95DRAFT_1605964 [Auriscalpium vulgare]